MTYELRYTAGTKRGDQFPSWVIGSGYPTPEAAEQVRTGLVEADQMHVAPTGGGQR